MYQVLKFLFGWIIRIIFPVKVFGPKKFEKKKTVFAMNHLRGIDPILFAVYFKPKTHFWGKKEVFKGKLFSWFLRKMGVIRLDRQGSDIPAFKQALTLLKNEKIFTLFPEGTRNLENPDRMLKLKRGIALLSIRAQSPVRLFFMHHKPKAFRKNYIIAGDEFSLEQFYGQKTTSEVLDEAMKIIEIKFDELKAKLTEILIQRGVVVRA